MTTQSTLPASESLVVSFDDNRLVADLLGEFDANLAMIEDRLGIQAVAHGNVVTLRGDEYACAAAKQVLDGLYVRLQAGEVLSAGDVDGAIRHADSGGSLAPASDMADEGRAAPTAQDVAQIKTRKRLISARTPAQGAYLAAMQNEQMVFATGPAGTGKTYLAVAYAAAEMERGGVDRLILSRPAVEAGERLGFLPGDMRDKVDPYLRPLYDALHDVAGPDRVQRGLENGAIEIAPLAFMRGRTLSDAVVILDEAQNCTPVQIKMFLTRLGENSKMIITGDPTQIDLPPGQKSGLTDAIELLQHIEGIGHIGFTRNDVVRRELVSRIVQAYESGR